jgi:hypothetical protein
MIETNQRVLVYVGCHVGNGLAKHIQNFDVVYAFEANPMFCSILSNKFGKNQNVHIFSFYKFNIVIFIHFTRIFHYPKWIKTSMSLAQSNHVHTSFLLNFL